MQVHIWSVSKTTSSIKNVNTQQNLCNSFTTAVRDFADIYIQTLAQGVRVHIISAKSRRSHGISDVYHLGHTHLISERTIDHSTHLVYTLTPDDRLWF